MKPSAHKIRKNRYKKAKHRRSGTWLKRLILASKCFGLLALLITFSVLLILAYTSITTTDYFSAKTIEVSGNRHLTRQKILAQAQFQPGDNILALNLRLMRKRLMRHPWISTVQISRQIPHTVTILVEEHRPLAALDLGRRLLVDDQGKIFKEYTAGDPDHFPVITGIAYKDLNPKNQSMSRPMQVVTQVLNLSRSGQSALPYEGIAVLHFDRETGVSLTMRNNNRLIKLGFGQFEEKNKKIGQLLKYLESKPQWRDICALDANNPDRIVVRPGKAPSAKGA